MDAASIIIADQENSPPLERDIEVLQKLVHVSSSTVGFSSCCCDDLPASSTSTVEMLEPVEIMSTNDHDKNNVKDNSSNPGQSLEIKDELCLLRQQQLLPFEETSLNELKNMLNFLTSQQIDCMLRINKIKRKDDLMYLSLGQLQEMGISEPKTVLDLMEVASVANLGKTEKNKSNQTTLNTLTKEDEIYLKSDIWKPEGGTNLTLSKDVNSTEKTPKDDDNNEDKELTLETQKDFGPTKNIWKEVYEVVNDVNDSLLSIEADDQDEPAAKLIKLRLLSECVQRHEDLLKAHCETSIIVSKKISFSQTLPVCFNNKESQRNAKDENDSALLVEYEEARDGFVIGNKETEHVEDDTNCILLPPSSFLVRSWHDHCSRSAPDGNLKSVDISITQTTTLLATNKIIPDFSGCQGVEETDGTIKDVKHFVSDSTPSLKLEESSTKQDDVINRTFQKIEENRVEPFAVFSKYRQVHECITAKDIPTSKMVKSSNLRRTSPRLCSDHKSIRNSKQQKSHNSPKTKAQTCKSRHLRLSKRKIIMRLPRKLKCYIKKAAASPTSDEENQQQGAVDSNLEVKKTENSQNFECVDVDLKHTALQRAIGESYDCNKTNYSEESNWQSLKIKNNLVRNLQDNIVDSNGEEIKATEFKSNIITTPNVDPRRLISYKDIMTFSSISENQTHKFTETDDPQAISTTISVKRRSFEANEDMPPNLKACKEENTTNFEYKLPSPTETVLRNTHEGGDIEIKDDINWKATSSDFSMHKKSPTHTVSREISFESAIFNTGIIDMPTNENVGISSPSPERNGWTERQSVIEIDARMRYPPIQYTIYEIDLSRNDRSTPVQINKLIKGEGLDPRVFRNQSMQNVNSQNPPSSASYQMYDTSAQISSSSTGRAQSFLCDPRTRSQYRQLQSPLTSASPQPSAQNAITNYNMEATQNLMLPNVLSHPIPSVSASALLTQSDKQNPLHILNHYLTMSPWYQSLLTSMRLEVNYTLSHLVRAICNFQDKRQYDPEAMFNISKIECCGEILKILAILNLIVEPNGNIVECRYSSLYGVRPSTTAMTKHAGISHQHGGETILQHREGIRDISTMHNADRFSQHMMNPSEHCPSLPPTLSLADCLNENNNLYLETPQSIPGYGQFRNHVPPASPISKECSCGIKTKYNYSNDRPTQRINDTLQSSSYNHCYNNNNSSYSKSPPYAEFNSRPSSPPNTSSMAPRSNGFGGGAGERQGRFKERRGGGGGGGYGAGRQSSNRASTSYNNRRYNNNNNNNNFRSNYNNNSPNRPSNYNNNSPNRPSNYNNNSPNRPSASPPTAQQSPLPSSPTRPSERKGSPVLNSPAKQQQTRPPSDEENWD